MNTTLEFFLFSNKALFLLYLIIAGNYLGNLFSCQIQHILHTNLYAKHLIGLATLIFFVFLADPNAEIRPFKQQMLAVAVLYTWFILSTKTDATVMVTIWSLLFIGYLLTVYIEKKNTKEETIANINLLTNVRFATAVIAAVITVIGMLIYMGEKKVEYGKKFRYLTFFMGKPDCRRFTPSKARATTKNWTHFLQKAFTA